MAMADLLWYVYGVVEGHLDAVGAPAGVDGKPVDTVSEGPLTALASHVEEGSFRGAEEAAPPAQIDWLAPRAEAHDGVLTWASDRAATIPFPMLTIFASEGAVRDMLRARAEELRHALTTVRGAREYTVRLFRTPHFAELGLAVLSPAIAGGASEAASAPPGERYLRERKLDELRRTETMRVGQDVAREVFDLLAGIARSAVQERLPKSARDAPPGGGGAVLNGSFLVPDDSIERFREGVTRAVTRYEPLGFRVEFTGPWAPYHFV
ncbi:MAG: GvpL/GvpF family gas vesicle protein [Gemmatimonadaceae bacterium]